jgi:hypothetical protein
MTQKEWLQQQIREKAAVLKRDIESHLMEQQIKEEMAKRVVDQLLARLTGKA